jgi:hypothetical protein
MTPAAAHASNEADRIEELERRVEKLEEATERHANALKLSGLVLNEVSQRVKRPLRRLRA